MRPVLRLLRALLVSSLLWASHGALPVASPSAESAFVVYSAERAAARAHQRVQPASRRRVDDARAWDPHDGASLLPPSAADRAPKLRLHLLHRVFLI